MYKINCLCQPPIILYIGIVLLFSFTKMCFHLVLQALCNEFKGLFISVAGPDMTIIQRSVSEKSRERSALSHHHHHHRPPYQQSSQQPPPPPPATSYQPDNRKLPHHIPQLKQQKTLLHSHVQSTPNVASLQRTSMAMSHHHHHHHHQASVTNVPAMCSAVSEGELLDLAILPIFQKLLSERHKSRTGYGASIASCPNISIKCDIVEYL